MMPLNKNITKVLVIGSGPIVIGQGAEFDYAGTQACLALKEEGIVVVLLNSNPATIMTDQTIANRVYIEPLTLATLEKVIAKERPDGLIGTLGGQTGLNLAVQLAEAKILEKYGVQVLGTSITSIQKGEDREKFRQLMIEINEPIPQSKIIYQYAEGEEFVKEVGYPVIIRPAYTLGGAGGGFAHHDEELEILIKRGLNLSPIQQVLIEKSIRGWKEIEYEVMRDANDTSLIVCNMENLDPVGVHTGDSIVVAPSQTLTDFQYQLLRQASLKVIRALAIIGGCNIQFALDPNSNQYYIIEVNPRVSRSSALASKATGYPIARIATKCAVGYHLDEIVNPITGNTYASFEPALDYVVVKLPRFAFDKFPDADRGLGTQMKATGEVMAIDRTFIGALNKGLRSLELNLSGLYLPRYEDYSLKQLKIEAEKVTDQRLFIVGQLLRLGMSVAQLNDLTAIDTWFLHQLKAMIDLEALLKTFDLQHLPEVLLRRAKTQHMSDRRISECLNTSEEAVRTKRQALGLTPVYKLVDTCAGEFDAETPYYYSTWQGFDEVEVTKRQKILVIGSGPIRIGQGIEFDYCSVHATMALKKQGYESIVMNHNPETVSTDYALADKLYFEPLTVEDILHVAQKEQVSGVMLQFGGQTALNVAAELAAEGVPLLGTSVAVINQLEDRELFIQLLTDLNISRIPGTSVGNVSSLLEVAKTLEFPLLVRPSYVIGGQAMVICYHEAELVAYTHKLAVTNERIWPLVVDSYLPGTECELDVISDGKQIVIPGIFQHVERAGVHSGDSVTVFPPISLTKSQKLRIVSETQKICEAANIIGIANVQFVIHCDEVIVLEVNPRASRTVPILSKVTGIPMIEWATRVQLGSLLSTITSELGLLQEPNYFVVKAPIFSAEKLSGVDHMLSPEMKSTGEVLGLGFTFAEALEKALFQGQVNLFEWNKASYIFCSFTDREKEAGLTVVKELINRRFKIAVTPGTGRFLKKHGLDVRIIPKAKEPLHHFFKEEEVVAAIILPSTGGSKETVGAYSRQLATNYQTPVFTSLDTVNCVLKLKEATNQTVATMDEYLKIRNEECLINEAN